MKAQVVWQASESELLFEGQTESGKTLLLDGNSQGLSPMESVLLSVGACSSVDVVEILRKARQGIHSCVCDIEAKRADSPPRVFTHIHAHYKVKGENISPKLLERAVKLSSEKYCSVMLMLAGNVEITTQFSVE